MDTPTSAPRARPRLLPMVALFGASFAITLALQRSPATAMVDVPATRSAAAQPELAPASGPASVEASSVEAEAAAPEPSPSLHELAADEDPAIRAEARALLALLDEETQAAW